MKTKTLMSDRVSFLLPFAVLLILCSIGIDTTLGQKKPTALKLDADADDKKLCAQAPLQGSQFCDYYQQYNQSGATEAQRRLARNEMIQLVRGQVDTYYKLRKDGRKTKIRWLQTLLDFLEIGAATSIAIMNGERARGVVGAALSGFQGGRTAFNKNFDVLQTQVLINKMKANRAEIFTEIVRSTRKTPSGYSWYAAKNDLRRYLFAGTFNDALDTLVDESGAGVVSAEKTLRVVEQGTIFGAVAPGSVSIARLAAAALIELREALKNDATKSAALQTLRAIVTALNEDEEIKAQLAAQSITASSEGEAIRKALMSIRGTFLDEGKDSLVSTINQTIVDLTAKEN